MNKTMYGAQRHNNPKAKSPRKNPVHCMKSRGSDSRPRCMRCQAPVGGFGSLWIRARCRTLKGCASPPLYA